MALTRRTAHLVSMFPEPYPASRTGGAFGTECCRGVLCDGKCVDSDSVCDQEDDCEGNSEEAACSTHGSTGPDNSTNTNATTPHPSFPTNATFPCGAPPHSALLSEAPAPELRIVGPGLGLPTSTVPPSCPPFPFFHWERGLSHSGLWSGPGEHVQCVDGERHRHHGPPLRCRPGHCWLGERHARRPQVHSPTTPPWGQVGAWPGIEATPRTRTLTKRVRSWP